MKLAEALALRADLQKRLALLKDRILRNATVQEGEEPAEDPAAMIEEFDGAAAELEALIKSINRTNSSARFDDDNSLADILARRDSLALRRDLLRDAAKTATVALDRRRALEVKFRPSISVQDTQRRADTLSREYRELDLRIQELNWSVDLV